MAAPRYTYTTELLTQAKTLHLPHNIHTLPINGKAAQYRFAVSTSTIFNHCEQMLRDVLRCTLGDQDGSEYLLTPLCSQWWPNSIMAQMIRTVTHVHAITPTLEFEAPTKTLQKKISQLLLTHSGYEQPCAVFQRRLSRFLTDDTIRALSPLRTLDTISASKHPFLTATVLETWLNGWCTSRRYQLTVTPCHFGCGAARGDQLEHYRCCPVLWNCFRRNAPRLYEQQITPDNYDPPDRHHTIPAAILLHTIYVTYETLRAHQQARGFGDYTDKTSALDTNLHLKLTSHPDLLDYITPWTYHPRPHRNNDKYLP